MDSIGSAMEALVSLLSIYYVFNIHWCPQVISTYFFFQSTLLKKEDKRTKECKNLSIFLSQFNEKVTVRDGASIDD
jgi:hypothetical protein